MTENQNTGFIGWSEEGIIGWLEEGIIGWSEEGIIIHRVVRAGHM